MKATQRDFAAQAPKAARSCRVFFLCGPDDAGVADAARLIVSLLAEPGERVEMTGAELKRDPVKLGDEARSNSLFGDARHIIVRVQGDEAHDAVDKLLAGDVEPCPVILTATGATDKSRTAKLLEKRDDALVAMFYPPDLRSVTETVRRMADGAGLRLNAEMAGRIARASGLDTRLAQSEVTKLALYLDAGPERPRTLEPAVLDALLASTEEEGLMPIVNAALNGDVGRIADELRRMRELNLSAVGVLLAMERRAAQLAQMLARLGPDGDVRAFVDGEKSARRIFWKDEADIANQLRRWRGAPIGRLTARLAALHASMMAHSQDADLFFSQSLAEIARVAARRR